MLTTFSALIERAQFAFNKCIYTPGALEFKGATGERSFLEYFLWETEKVHGKSSDTIYKCACKKRGALRLNVGSQGSKIHQVRKEPVYSSTRENAANLKRQP